MRRSVLVWMRTQYSSLINWKNCSCSSFNKDRSTSESRRQTGLRFVVARLSRLHDTSIESACGGDRKLVQSLATCVPTFSLGEEEHNVVVAAQALQYLGEIVVNIALRRQRGFELAARVDEADMAAILA